MAPAIAPPIMYGDVFAEEVPVAAARELLVGTGVELETALPSEMGGRGWLPSSLLPIFRLLGKTSKFLLMA